VTEALRSFEERPATVVGTAILLGAAFLGVAYLQLVRHAPPGTLLDPGQVTALGWVALAWTGLLFALSVVRVRLRHRIVLEPDRVRFGLDARYHLDRAQVAGVDRIGRAVELRLHAPDDPDVRSAAGLHGSAEVVHLEVARYRDGQALPSAVATWYAAL
jgi:hypothetical protein